MALPVLHKTAPRGWYRPLEPLDYTYVGADDFSDVPTVEDVYNLFSQVLFAGEAPSVLIKPDIALIISGEFFQPYPGHDPEEEVTTLSYGINALTAYESLRAHYDENPTRPAALWLNDLVQNFTQKYQSHEWFNVYRVSITD